MNNNIKYILLAIIFARWELLLVIIGFLIIRKIQYKKLFLIFLITSISVVILTYDPSYEQMQEKIEVRSGSLGLVSLLAELNQKGLYIPKFLINLFGDFIALNPFMLKGGYGLLIYSSQVMTFFLFFKLIRRRIFHLLCNTDILFRFWFCWLWHLKIFY